MKNFVTMVGIFSLALTIGAVGWAQQSGKQKGNRPNPAELIQQADTNKDGKVTFEELKAVRPKMTPERFKMLDTNGDGVLDSNDHPQAGQGQHGAAAFEAMMKQADANKDGKVTLEELKAVRPKMTEERFKKLDRDGDGALTKADMPKEGTAAAGTPETKPDAEKGGKMKEADVNNDGKVTFDELKAVRPKVTTEEFKKLDVNGDGVLTKEDRKTQP